jgi:flagellar assembly protein FliH
MSEKVIKAFQLKEVSRPVIVEPPRIETVEEVDLEEGEKSKEPAGPTPEELERMVQEKEREAEEKAKKIIQKAEEKAKKIKSDAEDWAFDQVKKVNEDYETKLKEAQMKAKQFEEESREKSKEIFSEAEKEAEKIRKDAKNQGFEQGREEGYQKGQEEVSRLVNVIHKISGELIQKRDTILAETEKELVDLVLLIANKVIKTMSETQKRVVYDNILSALSKLRIRAEVTIRIHPDDIYTVTKYKKDFIEMVEGVENIRILEDPNVDKGGCIVTSEFGSIDARISTQLAEIEEQIKKLSPIKSEE